MPLIAETLTLTPRNKYVFLFLPLILKNVFTIQPKTCRNLNLFRGRCHCMGIMIRIDGPRKGVFVCQTWFLQKIIILPPKTCWIHNIIEELVISIFYGHYHIERCAQKKKVGDLTTFIIEAESEERNSWWRSIRSISRTKGQNQPKAEIWWLALMHILKNGLMAKRVSAHKVTTYLGQVV